MAVPPGMTMPSYPPPPSHTSSPSRHISTYSMSSTTLAGGTSTPTSTTTAALRYPSTRKTIYDRNLNRSRNAELSRSSFAYLFMEMVSYAQRRVKGIADFEKRLNEQGYPLGLKLLDLLLYRATPAGSSSSSSTSSGGGTSGAANRPLRLLPLLTLLTTKLYPLLFSRPADSLEQSTTNPGEYMIIDNTPLTNQYISVPKEMNQLSVAAYIAGIIEGVCDGAGFECKASAHNTGTDVWPNRTVFLIKFEDHVLEREKELERQGVK
ncbi:Trafficking protein particle complex subunit 31 [Elasticomyces elasticus]|uniref:Trafficking protein particle complex subunit n=1 Tax=Exophiala sideris TaxID=1016849 RepID=A0ABR0JIH7_9EURO|nr:Trafficking protein particle complex subunit 31 [Elasticomyces elasticus]KAK5034407.1 Trafficking protein particle complex subunit 31 [Exophiala sideris]KAK5042704.1 Trafficking protein particle complex subunit 31 [Exophiala sideris]KAK5065786.1 Trafficking protein particle complex subunit 31 [Exophiala sideris]KAK5185754.1 Trafficking protein particle complex subunit 31 [Eurotiomycetes sp. CCFEE 6388]